MENKKLPLPEHVIRAMRRDDGFIRCEAGGTKPRYAVYVLTAVGYKRLCAVSAVDMERLYTDGFIEHVGDGRWKLKKQLPYEGNEHKL